jgi:hypothetical protein
LPPYAIKKLNAEPQSHKGAGETFFGVLFAEKPVFDGKITQKALCDSAPSR